MVASKIHLLSIGPQDYHLSANPQITHFKSVFRRYTNFSIDYQKIYFSGEEGEDFSKSCYAKVKHDGDLLGKLFLEVNIAGKTNEAGAYTVNHFGNSLIKKVELIIGGYKIDTLYSQWLQIYQELTNPTESKQTTSDIKGGKFSNLNFNSDLISTEIDIKNRICGDMPLVFGGGVRNNNSNLSFSKNDNVNDKYYYKKIFVPLPFWFTKKSGMYLPLCSIYNHEIEIKIDFEDEIKLKGDSKKITELKIKDISLYGEFVHLAEDEKKRFTQSNHEYIIEQHQLSSGSHTLTNNISSNSDNIYELDNKKYGLFFDHPVKYITWVVVNEGDYGYNAGQGPCYFTSLTTNSLYGNDGYDGKVNIKLNGQDKEPQLAMSYYTRLFPKNYLKNIPDLDRIGFYSFSLNPLEIEPSGTCNFSKIENFDIELILANNNVVNIKNKKIYFFAVNYNVLIITDGMVMVRYS